VWRAVDRLKYIFLLPIFLYLMGVLGFGALHFVDHADQEMPWAVLFFWSSEEGLLWPIRLMELLA
jgi:hypothetical protein